MASTKEDKTASTALASVATGGLPADMLDELAADAGAGTSQSADDNIVPFIVLLQDMSPEVKKRDPEYVEGAEVGMLMNKATKQLYAADAAQAEATGFPLLVFQHCAFDRAIIEWVPRNDGGGFVARHDLKGTPEQTMTALGAKQVPDPQDPNKKNWKTADGKNDLIDTRYHFGHVINNDGTISPAVLAFSSTGHTASREWMTLMNNAKIKHPATGALVVAPAWSKSYLVTSKARNNKKGDFFVMSVADNGWIGDKALRDEGKKLNEAFSKGTVRADEAPAGDEPAEDVAASAI